MSDKPNPRILNGKFDEVLDRVDVEDTLIRGELEILAGQRCYIVPEWHPFYVTITHKLANEIPRGPFS